MTCRHCQKSRATRPRRLCWACYHNLEIREMYPPSSKFARRGILDFTGQSRADDVPTSAPPGSEEKIAVLAERARLGLVLWHPLDGRC